MRVKEGARAQRSKTRATTRPPRDAPTKRARPASRYGARRARARRSDGSAGAPRLQRRGTPHRPPRSRGGGVGGGRGVA